MSSAVIDYPAASVFDEDYSADRNSLHSDAGKTLISLYLKERQDMARTTATRKKMANSLDFAKAIASTPDWDDQGALPMDEGAASSAEHLIACMPANLPAAEITPSNDGSVLMEWRNSDQERVLVKVKRHGKISFAAVSAKSLIYGDESISAFNSTIVPKIQQFSCKSGFGFRRR